MSAPDDPANVPARDARLAVPTGLEWLRDEAGLRPPAIARAAGLTPDQLARWAAGAWTPEAADVPLLPALAGINARVRASYEHAGARIRWWTAARRELGWLSPGELLRRGRLGEVLLLLTEHQPSD